MKLPVSVITEALEPLAVWRISAEDSNRCYGYPRHFDGGSAPSGHAALLSAGSVPPAGGDVLSVCAAPPDAPVPGAALIPDRAVDGARIERTLCALFDRMESWEEDLLGCSPDRSGVQRMLEISAEAMNGSLGLIDESYNMPAYTGMMAQSLGLTGEEGARRPDDLRISGLADDPQITAARSLRGVRLYDSPTAGPGEELSLFRNLFRPGENHYFNRLLFFRSPARYTELDRFMLERLGERLEPIMRSLSTYSMPVSRFAALQSLLLSAAGSDREPPGDISAALAPLGWRPEDRCRVLIFRSLYERRDPGISEYILRRLEQLIPASCGVMDGERLLLVMNAGRAEMSFREVRAGLAEFLRENMYKAGISGEAPSFDRLRGAYRQAAAAVQLGSLRNPMHWYYLFEDYLSDYLLHKAGEDIPAEMLMLPAVGVLRRHDAARGTHFVETLRALCSENFSVTHAARRLYIHRTTFQDRMDRIRALTGLDPENEETRFLLQFGFRLCDEPGAGSDDWQK